MDIKKLQATLTDNPLLDGGTAEILVDDPKVQKITGKWDKLTTGGFGPSLLVNTSKEPSSLCFAPDVKKAGRYQIYLYYPKIKNMSDATQTGIFDGKKWTEKVLQNAAINIAGQTSGEWISLGTFDLPAGNKACVEVSNKNANGAVAADATLFVPVVK